MNIKKGIVKDWVAKFGDDLLSKNFMFYLFIAFLGILYIANSHHNMKQIKQINTIAEELKTKRWFYVQAISKRMHKTKLSEMKKDVERLGLNELLEPAQVVTIENVNQNGK